MNETPDVVPAQVNSTFNFHENAVNDTAKMCGPPQKLDEYLNYKRPEGLEPNEVLTREHGSFVSGTEIQFSCLSSGTGERKTWKIICDHGTWIGKSTECGK